MFHDVIKFITRQTSIIDLLIDIALEIIAILIIRKVKEMAIISKIDAMQEKFYKTLPTDEYLKIELTCLDKYNEKYFTELYSSFNFYAQQRPNDIIILLVVDPKTATLVHKTQVHRKTIEIETVFYEEKANFKDDDSAVY